MKRVIKTSILVCIMAVLINASTVIYATNNYYNINVYNYYFNNLSCDSGTDVDDEFMEFCRMNGCAGVAAIMLMNTIQHQTSQINYTINIRPEDYPGYFDKYRDLYNRMYLTEEDMNLIISKYADENSVFYGNGISFIRASNRTGLDPVFLFALAGYESGYGSSEKHIDKNNYYSINMTDENPHNGFNLGDTFEEGIINGAIWIKENYYDKGKTTLDEMNDSYCSNALWKRDIRIIMTNSFRVILNSHKEG